MQRYRSALLSRFFHRRASVACVPVEELLFCIAPLVIHDDGGVMLVAEALLFFFLKKKREFDLMRSSWAPARASGAYVTQTEMDRERDEACAFEIRALATLVRGGGLLACMCAFLAKERRKKKVERERSIDRSIVPRLCCIDNVCAVLAGRRNRAWRRITSRPNGLL